MTALNFAELQAAKRGLSSRFRRYEQVTDAQIESIGIQLAGLENIVGVATEYKVKKGEFTDQPCIKVYVVKKLVPAFIDEKYLVPSDFEGFATDVEGIGEIVAESDTRCYDVLEGGISVGHLAVSAGTLGCFVRKAGGTRQVFALSNNHVLANCNNCRLGDWVVQPGPKDRGGHTAYQHPGRCGSPDTCIGTLSGWHPIDPNKDNDVDAAIAEVLWRKCHPRIRLLGPINGVERAQIDAKVVKVGRTTDLTSGTIAADDADIRVRYTDNAGKTLFTAWFVNQIAVRWDNGPFTRGGDSGAAYLTENNKIVGLHFAGGNGRSFGNHIRAVFYKLGIDDLANF